MGLKEGRDKLMDELKPCPFCGGKAILQSAPPQDNYFVSCRKCGATTMKYFPGKEEAAVMWNRRAAPENKLEKGQAMIQRAMREIKEEHCGDYDCLLPENKLDDSRYWADDAACNDCTYGACYLALERSLHTAAPENKAQQLCEEDENFIQTKFGYCFYTLDSRPLIYNLYVNPQYRRRGHSRELLESVIIAIRKDGYKGEIRIQAKPRDDSIGLAD